MANELHVVGQATLAGALRDLVPIFEKESGERVQLLLGNPGVTATRIREKTPADALILSTNLLTTLVGEGLVEEAGKVPLGRTSIGMGMAMGAPKPAFANAADFIALLRRLQTIGLVDPKGGSGTSPPFMKAVAALGLEAEISPKYRYFPGAGEAVADAIARGEVEAGVTAIPELAANKRVAVIGPIPRDVLDFGGITYALVAKDAKNPAGARKFLAFLKSPIATKAFVDLGLVLVD